MSKLGDTLLDNFLERRDKMRVRDKETRRDDEEKRGEDVEVSHGARRSSENFSTKFHHLKIS